MYKRIDANIENLDKLFDLLDNLIVNNSDKFLLDEVEKNSLYEFKSYILEELVYRLSGGKPTRRLNVNLK